MKAISIRDMRSELGNLDQLVEFEGEFIVTKRGNLSSYYTFSQEC